MGDLEDLIRSRLALSVFVQGIFNDVKLLDARDWKIYGGIGKYFNTPQVPFGVTDTARATRLGIVARYGAALQPNVVARGNSKGEIDGFDFPRSLDEATRMRPQIHPLFFIMRRADLVWDDADELIRSEFPYPAVANLTPSVRAQVYGGSLTQIKPPADDSNTGFFDTGEQFYVTAAAQATYATALDGQPYYPKWKTAKRTAKDRLFAFDQLSDVYLQQNFQAYDLEKGAVHLFLQIEQTSLVTKLYQDNQGRFRDEAIAGQHLPMVGNYFTALADRIKALKAKNSKVQGVAWFVYTLEGTDHAPTFTGLNTAVTATLTMNVREQVVDPQVVVMSAGKLSLEQLDPVQKAFGRRDWLKEMVRLRFS
jgi:hypothetical protein